MRMSVNHIAIQSRPVEMVYLPGTEQPQVNNPAASNGHQSCSAAEQQGMIRQDPMDFGSLLAGIKSRKVTGENMKSNKETAR